VLKKDTTVRKTGIRNENVTKHEINREEKMKRGKD
jgi:hypothetical protein